MLSASENQYSIEQEYIVKRPYLVCGLEKAFLKFELKIRTIGGARRKVTGS